MQKTEGKMIGAFKMEWKIGKKMCVWVGFHHFCWQWSLNGLGIWIVVVKIGENFGTL
jgi:hypothetical protein